MQYILQNFIFCRDAISYLNDFRKIIFSDFYSLPNVEMFQNVKCSKNDKSRVMNKSIHD